MLMALARCSTHMPCAPPRLPHFPSYCPHVPIVNTQHFLHQPAPWSTFPSAPPLHLALLHQLALSSL